MRCGAIEVLAGEHAVVRIPKIALAPQQHADREDGGRIHPRRPLGDRGEYATDGEEAHPVEHDCSQQPRRCEFVYTTANSLALFAKIVCGPSANTTAGPSNAGAVTSRTLRA